MYLRILKKDLKRKKTMNIILLLFIILSSMFVASSVNNILTVTNALDDYFQKAGMSDYFVATMDKAGGRPITDIFDEIPEIDSYGIEHILYMSRENVIYQGEELEGIKNTPVLMAFEDAQLNYFDSDNQVIQEIKPGTIWISGKHIYEGKLNVGDTIEIKIEDVSVSFEVAGALKDAALGSDMMGMMRFVLSESDFEKFKSDEAISDMYGGSLCYINSTDTEAVEQALNEEETGIIFLDDASILKMSYVMDMVIAGVLLVVSICLILIAFVVLKFTISFTLTEEYREIGVMKAIGINNIKIRSLYMIKYFTLAILGSVLGFIASIPFGNMLLASVSQSIVMNSDNRMFINVICSIAVVLIILLFCFGCTGKVKRFTPVDAIRSGTTGERFQKKGILRLHQNSLKPSFFMAANDVLSSPRRFGTVVLIFTLCLSLVLILVNTVNTLRSEELVPAFGISQSDVFLADDSKQMALMVENGKELLEKELRSIEETLAEHGMAATCVNEVMLKLTLTNGEHTCKSQILQGVGTTTDQYEYFEGTPPQNVGEIAITPLIAEKLDASIGDTVTIRHSDGEREYMITAFFQSMNNLGEGVRLHEDVVIDYSQLAGFFAFQINFTDNPDDAEIAKRIQKIKEIYGIDQVYSAGEYVERMTGVAGMLDGIRILVLALIMIIIILVTVLMERSFIAKERAEIATLKAMGFTNGSIIKWHTIRFGIISMMSTIIALIFSKPLTSVSVGPVFNMMGADYGIQYKIVPLEVYVLYPLIVVALTIVSAFMTALYTRTIKASEASSIE